MSRSKLAVASLSFLLLWVAACAEPAPPTAVTSTPVLTPTAAPTLALTPTPRKEAPVQAIQIEAKHLYTEYLENQVRADLKYKGRPLQVSGVIGEIGQTFGAPYIILDGMLLVGVRAEFDREKETEVAQLSLGQRVTVVCYGDGKTILVKLKQCAVVTEVDALSTQGIVAPPPCPSPTTPAPISTPASTPVVDDTPPSTPGAFAKISPDNNPLPAFKWAPAYNAAAGIASYEVRVDSGAWISVGQRLTYVQPTILSKGSHTISVRAKDTAGNVGLLASMSFNVSVVADLANTKVAFTSERDGNREIYSMNPDGSDQIRLTENSAEDSFPTWSPDGSKIAFYSDRDGNYEIYVMNRDSTDQTRLTFNSADDVFPAWSPDGSKIAFNSGRDGNSEVYVMNSDGTHEIRLTCNKADDTYPAWSPDGSKIAFSSSRDGRTEIYAMNADGSGEVRVSNGAFSQYSAWSPNGSRIAFYSFRDDNLRDGNLDIYVMNPEGSDRALLTENSAHDVWPTWSPDGSRIAFSSGQAGSYDIYFVSADGSSLTRLTNEPSSDFAPSWSPFLASVTGTLKSPSATATNAAGGISKPTKKPG